MLTVDHQSPVPVISRILRVTSGGCFSVIGWVLQLSRL